MIVDEQVMVVDEDVVVVDEDVVAVDVDVALEIVLQRDCQLVSMDYGMTLMCTTSLMFPFVQLEILEFT